jgi:hypothetical protein
MITKKTRDPIPTTQEKRDASFAEIMKDLSDDAPPPPFPSPTWTTSWSLLRIATLALMVVIAFVLMVDPLLGESREGFFGYLALDFIGVFWGFLVSSIALRQADRRSR